MSNRDRSSFWPGLAIIATVVAVIVFPIVMSVRYPVPVDETGAMEMARRLGYVNIVVVERFGGQTVAWQQGCGEGETSAVAMRALGADGATHDLLLCCGGAARRSCNARTR